MRLFLAAGLSPRHTRSFMSIAFLAGAAAIAGCATITKGTSQSIAIVTPNAPGATCTLTSDALGSRTVTTPATVAVEKSKDNINVVCKKACFQDGAGVVVSGTEAMTAGNIIAGGVIGLGVDAASGALNKYAAETQIHMTPIPGCGASAPTPMASAPARRK